MAKAIAVWQHESLPNVTYIWQDSNLFEEVIDPPLQNFKSYRVMVYGLGIDFESFYKLFNFVLFRLAYNCTAGALLLYQDKQPWV